jgi:hypothetical protein
MPADPDDPLLPSRKVADAIGAKAIKTVERRVESGALPPPDVIINHLKYWKQSTIRRHVQRLVDEQHERCAAERKVTTAALDTTVPKASPTP